MSVKTTIIKSQHYDAHATKQTGPRPSPQAPPRGPRHVGTRQPERKTNQITSTEGLLPTTGDKKLTRNWLIRLKKNYHCNSRWHMCFIFIQIYFYLCFFGKLFHVILYRASEAVYFMAKRRSSTPIAPPVTQNMHNNF